MKNLNAQMHNYVKVRKEGPPHIPCDPCMGGMEAPWHIAFYLGDESQVEKNEAPLAYVICAQCVMDISGFIDTCTDCIPDPTADRVCDSCGKEYRRKKVVAPESTSETPERAVA